MTGMTRYLTGALVGAGMLGALATATPASAHWDASVQFYAPAPIIAPPPPPPAYVGVEPVYGYGYGYGNGYYDPRWEWRHRWHEHERWEREHRWHEWHDGYRPDWR